MQGYVAEMNGSCVFRKVQEEKMEENGDSGVWLCDNLYIGDTEACRGACNTGWELCGASQCKAVGDDTLKTCGDRLSCLILPHLFLSYLILSNPSCINMTTACEGACPANLTFLCGGQCYSEVNKFFYKECGGVCVPKSAPCDGQCPSGQFLCGGESIQPNLILSNSV